MSRTTYLAISMFILGCLITTYVSGEVRYAIGGDPIISPSDHITNSDIKVYSDRTVIDKKLNWATIEDTHSMEPVLNVNSISLELTPQTPYYIKEVDIISFKEGSIVIIHRVIIKGEDSQGIFFVTKGDNNNEPDPYKVRFNQIKGVVVGILY